MLGYHFAAGCDELLLQSEIPLHCEPLCFTIAEVVLGDCRLDGLAERLFGLAALRGGVSLDRVIGLHELLGDLLDLFEVDIAFFVELQSRLLNELVNFLVEVVVPL